MKPLLLILFLLVVQFTSFSQSVNVGGGVSYNDFRNKYYDPAESGVGHSYLVSVDDIKVKKVILRFTLRYDNYSGDFSFSNGGLMYPSWRYGTFRKSTVSIGLYPLNLYYKSGLHFSLGAEFGRLVSDETQVYSSGYGVNDSGEYYSYSTELSGDIHGENYAGVAMRVGFEFRLGRGNFSLEPQILSNIIFTEDFYSYKTWRNSLELTLGYNFSNDE